MGIISQAVRSAKRSFRSMLDTVLRRKKKRRHAGRNGGKVEEVTVPRAWSKPGKSDSAVMKPQIVIKYKKRIRGLKTVKRILASILLIINFGFSQFTLGAIGTQAQPLFIIFLLNSWICIEYLWKTRRSE